MVESLWNGFKRLDFEFEGRNVILVCPNTPNADKNWLFKMEYFDAFPGFEIEMLKRGWHLAFTENLNRWSVEEDLDLKKRFADYLSKEYGLYKKFVPVGMSCGGLFSLNFAAKYPQYISALYIDAPVVNLLSCPAALGKREGSLMEEFTKATGMDIIDLMSYREHPLDKMHLLLNNNLPIIMVYGDSDISVPYDENGAFLEKYYRENNGTIVTIEKKNAGHHPHGLDDSTPIIEFVEKHSK